jgi:hypothetical protein
MREGRWGSSPRPRDYGAEAIGRTGPVAADSSENRCACRPVESDPSGGVVLVCRMKRGIRHPKSGNGVMDSRNGSRVV